MNEKHVNEDVAPQCVDTRSHIGIAEIGTASETTKAMIVWGLADGATVWPYIADINPWG